jgi:hypothetical protein
MKIENKVLNTVCIYLLLKHMDIQGISIVVIYQAGIRVSENGERELLFIL